MKDCSERKSFATETEAKSYTDWQRREGIIPHVIWKCHRCDRYHISGGHEQAVYTQQKMQRQRCVSDRDLHLQMARVAGVSLEELQRTMRLDLIKVSGPGIQLIEVEVIVGR